MHLTAKRNQRVINALKTTDLDPLVPLVTSTQPAHAVPAARLHSILRHVFAQSRQEKLNLFHPPPDFHNLLLVATAINVGHALASTNTIHLRLSLLPTLCTTLQDQGLLLIHQLRELQRPPNKRLEAPLLSRTHLERLHLYAQSDSALYAVLVLIGQHAYWVQDLLALTWQDFDFATGSALHPCAPTPSPG